MATDGHIESIHQVANGKIHALLGHGRFLPQYYTLFLIFIYLSIL